MLDAKSEGVLRRFVRHRLFLDEKWGTGKTGSTPDCLIQAGVRDQVSGVRRLLPAARS
jgi:hypothetical protein